MTDGHNGAIGHILANRRQRDRDSRERNADARSWRRLEDTACGAAEWPELATNWQLYRSIAKQFWRLNR